MPSPSKKPRRTAERILDTALGMFNRFGEPNVSTTAISAELNISPGNLYYHFPAKDILVNTLFDRYAESLETWRTPGFSSTCCSNCCGNTAFSTAT